MTTTNLTPFYRAFPLIGFLCLFVVFSGCSKTITPEDRARAIAQTTSELLDHHGSLNNRAITNYLSSVIHRLDRAAAGTPSLMEFDDKKSVASWQVFILESQQANVFSVSSGLIFISRGMLAEVSGEAELAAILAHEMAHEYLGHHADALDAALRAETKQAFHFELGQEIEADHVSIELMSVAGYDIRGAARAISTLYRDSNRASVGSEMEWREKRVGDLLDKIEEEAPNTRRITNTRAFHRMKTQLKHDSSA